MKIRTMFLSIAIAGAVGCGNSADDYWLEGNHLTEKGKYVMAISRYDKCLAIDPSHLECHFNKGIVLFNTSRYEESLAVFDMLISLEPNYPEAEWYRGMVKGILENFGSAK